MGDERVDACDGDGRRITRRVAIGTGIAAVGAGTMWAPSASATASSPGQLLTGLKAEIRRSSAQRLVKSQLLSILGQAGEQLAHGQNLECRQTLRLQFVPLVKDAGGRYGITRTAARRWSADAERLARALPGRDAGPSAGAGGKVTVFNCYNEPVTGLAIAGYVVGDISSYSEGGAGKPPRYTPSSLVVARSKTPEQKALAIGDNRVVLPWNSFTGEATVRIPDPRDSAISLDDDLLLFVAANRITLMTTRGQVVADFRVELHLGRPRRRRAAPA